MYCIVLFGHILIVHVLCIDFHQKPKVSRDCVQLQITSLLAYCQPCRLIRYHFLRSHYRSLTNHIHLAELIKAETQNVDFREKWQTERSMIEGEARYEIIEDLIACQYPPYRVLRLLCLQSLCGGGIKSSRFDSLRRDFVQTYG